MTSGSRESVSPGNGQGIELDTETQFRAGDYAQLIGCCASCVLVVTAVVVVASVLLSTTHNTTESKQRTNYTQMLLDSLDRSIRPCDNFYKFVCSGWIKNQQKGYHTLIDALEAETVRATIEALEAVPEVREVTTTSSLVSRGTSGLPHGAPEPLTANTFTKEKKIPSERDIGVPKSMPYIYPERKSARMLTEKSAVHKAASMYKSCQKVASQGRTDDTSLIEFLRIYTKFPNTEIADVDVTVDHLVELSLVWKIHVLFVVDVFADHDDRGKPTVSLSGNNELETWSQLRQHLSGSGKLREFIQSHVQLILDVASSNTEHLLESIVRADNEIIPSLVGGSGDITAPTFGNLPDTIGGTTATTWLDAVNKQTQSFFNVSSGDYVKLDNVGYFKQVGKLLSTGNPGKQKQLSLFLGWHTLRQLAPFASYKAVEVLYKDEKEFHHACFSRVLEVMPLTVIHPLLKLLPAPKALNITAAMVKDIRAALGQVFNHTPWMDHDTTQAALSKLDAMRQVLLSPNFIQEEESLDSYYSDYKLFPDYFTTHMQAAKMSTQLKLETLTDGETVDNFMFQPLQVNAFYERNLNAMFIPSGIIRAPYLNENLSWPFNFAGLGAVVGHEIMHGFDTKGKDRDAAGQLSNWWSPDVESAYDKRVNCLVHAYNADADAMEENVADFASMPAVLTAYAHKSSTADATGSGSFDDQFTREQQFFLNYCFKLCSRTAAVAAGYATDENRCNVPLRHLRDFAEAFECQQRDPMNPKDKCNFWE